MVHGDLPRSPQMNPPGSPELGAPQAPFAWVSAWGKEKMPMVTSGSGNG